MNQILFWLKNKAAHFRTIMAFFIAKVVEDLLFLVCQNPFSNILKNKNTHIAVYAGHQHHTAIYVQSDMSTKTITAPQLHKYDSKINLNYSPLIVIAVTIHTLVEFHNIFCLNYILNT